MNSPDVLLVASSAKWVYEDLAAVSKIPVKYSHGFDLPDLSGYERPAVWTSTGHAARLKRAGIPLPLTAPGPEWLADVPENLRGRKIGCTTFGALRNAPGLMELEDFVWIKLAEMKHEALPAQRTYLRDFILKMESLGAPLDTKLQYCTENLWIVREDRCFILDGKVITSSPYMQLGDIWDYDKHTGDPEWKPSAWSEAFAEYVAVTMKGRSPRAYTLDVAQVMPNEVDPDYHVVLEANPVWSSAIYGADPEKALQAILAGVDYEPTKRSRLWQPDPWLIKRAETMIRLK